MAATWAFQCVPTHQMESARSCVARDSAGIMADARNAVKTYNTAQRCMVSGQHIHAQHAWQDMNWLPATTAVHVKKENGVMANPAARHARWGKGVWSARHSLGCAQSAAWDMSRMGSMDARHAVATPSVTMGRDAGSDQQNASRAVQQRRSALCAGLGVEQRLEGHASSARGTHGATGRQHALMAPKTALTQSTTSHTASSADRATGGCPESVQHAPTTRGAMGRLLVRLAVFQSTV